ncbi:hypothetical protein BT69DRAFT_789543 [Atractiella rhizophila]|nr:hypothetical protein BT69DRAFT_789543 [Atractiella rhizophila]
MSNNQTPTTSTSQSPAQDDIKKGKKKSVPIVYACDYCRSLKRKCIRVKDREPPVCSLCVDRGVECVFKPRKKKKSKFVKLSWRQLHNFNTLKPTKSCCFRAVNFNSLS